MPLYLTACKTCEAEYTIYRKVDERNNLDDCSCGGKTERRVTAPFVAFDITPYVSPATGKVINSRVQMRYDLEASGSIMNEPGLKKDIARRKTDIEEQTFAPVAAAVDATVTQLVNAGKLEA